MFARKTTGGFQLFEDDGSPVVIFNDEAGSGIYPVNNIDSDCGYDPKTGKPNLLGMSYENSSGEAFILTPEDFEKLSSKINIELE